MTEILHWFPFNFLLFLDLDVHFTKSRFSFVEQFTNQERELDMERKLIDIRV